jgi:hypothetical protein
MPERCPVLRQYSKPAVEVGDFFSGRYPHVYKVYFTMESDLVWILLIRPWVRDGTEERGLLA